LIILGANSIGDNGIKELIRIDMNLTHLDLGHNRITTEGAKVIANLLKSNTSLLSLNLGISYRKV